MNQLEKFNWIKSEGYEFEYLSSEVDNTELIFVIHPEEINNTLIYRLLEYGFRLQKCSITKEYKLLCLFKKT